MSKDKDTTTDTAPAKPADVAPPADASPDATVSREGAEVPDDVVADNPAVPLGAGVSPEFRSRLGL